MALEEIQAGEAVNLASYGVEAARESRTDLDEGMTLTEQKAAENDGTMVTVVCITYKHEAFIAQALDSFLMQRTTFKFKVFVGEDCGPDGTADIVREYARRYPDIIVPFIREENMGAQHNLIDLCQRATSPYIAFCEGDDYWIDEYKLQKQVDYMESHPEVRVCGMETEIDAPEDWHLRSWYRKMDDGKLLLPNSTPGFCLKKKYSPASIINLNVAHTSTHFYRWNYDLEIPEWYYKGIVGDMPMLLLQLGTTELGFLPEVASVYRINEGSAFYDKDRQSNFLRTRTEYVRYLTGLVEYARTHFKGYPITTAENRIKLEAANYLRVLVEQEDTDGIARFFAEYPEGGRIALNAYLSFYRDQRLLTGCLGWDGYKTAVRDKYCRNLLKPVVRRYQKMKRFKNKLKKLKGKVKGKLRNLAAFFLYWKNTRVKKDRSLWVFSGFNKKGYMDNSKYLYEYVVEHCPEIRAVWLTLDKAVFEQLTEEGKPVMMMRTRECRRLAARAAIGVTDHFRMSDYDAFSGLNDQMKIVQLWHGVGLKTIGDLKNTNVPGVVFSDDILPREGDGNFTRRIKKIKYFRHAYYRELFEKYFMLVCPGQERVEQIAKPWNIPLDACFFSGHPRNVYLHRESGAPCERSILYAPTYRWDAWSERNLVRQIEKAGEQIQVRLEETDSRLVIRLHPHTWRNYSRILERIEEKFERISVDREKDIYQSLAKYAVVITDYSSIAYDFVLLDRPVVFFNYDFKNFTDREIKLNYDYEEYSPGIKTKTWEETMDAVEAYLADPEKDGPWRRRIRDEFYDMAVNDENNSRRIVEEIKRRLAETE